MKAEREYPKKEQIWKGPSLQDWVSDIIGREAVIPLIIAKFTGSELNPS
jgi:hypothetical protein